MIETKISPVVRMLVITTVSAFLIQLVADTFLGAGFTRIFAFVPNAVLYKHYYWQFFTYMFVHADLFHILFNMLILWMIGTELELTWGRKFFLQFYFVCGISASLFYFLVQFLFRGSYVGEIPMVGCSGAVYGLLVAYGILFSERTLLFMMVFPMKAKHFVLVLGAIEFISTVFYSQSGVANAAHLGGMVAGFLFLWGRAYFLFKKKASALNFERKPKKINHLKLVVNNRKSQEKQFEVDTSDSDNDKPTFH